mmetsp:Transcript_46456/g.148313  ORF Transcript_46456/g.148313 Transcript_46456/m.148313 type:complete len:335 (-) Transcript_46456:240-1244(-)
MTWPTAAVTVKSRSLGRAPSWSGMAGRPPRSRAAAMPRPPSKRTAKRLPPSIIWWRLIPAKRRVMRVWYCEQKESKKKYATRNRKPIRMFGERSAASHVVSASAPWPLPAPVPGRWRLAAVSAFCLLAVLGGLGSRRRRELADRVFLMKAAPHAGHGGGDPGRRSALLGASAALGGLSAVAVPESAWADGNPWPYDVSRPKIAKRLAPFTGKACPDPLVQVSLGDAGEGLRFVPDRISLVQGCYTELALSNPSTLEHNFVAPDFAKSVYTVVVLAGSPPAELKGQVGELELKPGASLGWFLVPVKSGDFELKCTVKGHTEGGMVGRIAVTPQVA